MGMHQRKASREKLYITFNPQRPEQALAAEKVLDLVSRILKWLPENLNWVLSRVGAGAFIVDHLLPIIQQSQIAFWYARGDTSLSHPKKAWWRKLQVHTTHRHTQTNHTLVGVTPICMDYPSDNNEHNRICWQNIRQVLSIRRPHTREYMHLKGGSSQLPDYQQTSPAIKIAPGTLVAFRTEWQSLPTSLELHLLNRIESQELLKDVHSLRIPEEKKYHKMACLHL